MKFTLPDLPYPVTALEPVIGRETLELHHDAHHQAYVDKLNEAIEKAGWKGEETIQQLLMRLDSLPSAFRSAVRNFGGGHANHCLLWETLTPSSTKPPATLEKLIGKEFGNLTGLRSAMADQAEHLFGSGWVFFSWDPRSQKLSVDSLPNQDSPYSQGLVPLLPLDLWEHAHYLDYRNRRPEWVANWWYLVDWQKVEQRLELAQPRAA